MLKKNILGQLSDYKLCKIGHVGANCEECDLYGQYWGGDAYSKTQTLECVKCSELGGAFMSLFFISFWTMISLYSQLVSA